MTWIPHTLILSWMGHSNNSHAARTTALLRGLVAVLRGIERDGDEGEHRIRNQRDRRPCSTVYSMGARSTDGERVCALLSIWAYAMHRPQCVGGSFEWAPALGRESSMVSSGITYIYVTQLRWIRWYREVENNMSATLWQHELKGSGRCM